MLATDLRLPESDIPKCLDGHDARRPRIALAKSLRPGTIAAALALVQACMDQEVVMFCYGGSTRLAVAYHKPLKAHREAIESAE